MTTRRHSRPVALLLALLFTALLAGCGSSTAPPRLPEPAPAPAAPAGLNARDVNAWLDGIVPATLERTGIAGATVSVVHQGRILTARGYGRADTGTGDQPARPVDPDRTLFRVGSISKVFTAVAVLQLAEQGRLDLDGDVNAYLDFELPAPRGTITPRHLLTHTAGFEERVRSLILPAGAPHDLREHVTEDPPEQIFVPGTTPAYSNYGYSLAGYLVQRVSGQPFADYVQEHVLDPIGMTSSTFAQPLPDELAPRLASAYADDAQAPTPFETVAAAPAGSLSASATDMARLMLFQLGERPGQPAVLKPETLARMHRPALGADTLGTLANGRQMALGLFDDSRNGRAILGHDGDTDVFHSALEFYPDDRTGIFLSTNSTGRADTDAYLLREHVTQGFGDRYFPAPPASAAVQDTAAEHAAMAVGVYETSRATRSNFLRLLSMASQIRVAAGPDDTLLISPGPESLRPVAYAEVAPWVWREVGGQHTVSMRAMDGRVEAIGGPGFTLLRVDAAHRADVALPIAAVSVGILLLTLLGWPFRAAFRRHWGVPRPAHPAGAIVGRLRRVGVGAALLAVGGWVLVAMAALAFRDVPDAPIRLVQAAQLLGVLALVPAALHLVAVVRRRARWTDVVGAVLVVAALAGLAWFAVIAGLLAPSVSY